MSKDTKNLYPTLSKKLREFNFQSIFFAALFCIILGIWAWEDKLSTSNFLFTLSITFVGAFAGVWGAQQIISKIEHKRQLLEEIRNTRAALALAEDVVTAYLNMKEQKYRD